jgi:hypothetical protein
MPMLLLSAAFLALFGGKPPPPPPPPPPPELMDYVTPMNVALAVGAMITIYLINFIMNPYPEDPGTNSYKGIMVFASRTVSDMGKYKTTFADFATKAQAGGKGVRALFSFVDPESASKVVQFAFYDSPADYLSTLSQEASAMKGCYAASSTDYLQFFGDCDSVKAEATNKAGATCHFPSKKHKGFIRPPNAGYAYKNGPPMIWVSKRKTKPDIVETYLNEWQKAVNIQYFVAPGLVASTEKVALETPDHVWSVRVFTDYNKGFYNHAMKGFPFLLYQLMANTLPKLAPPFPLGLSFCTKKDLDGAIMMNPGNKSYKGIYWDSIIGPMPDFAKGC